MNMSNSIAIMMLVVANTVRIAGWKIIRYVVSLKYTDFRYIISSSVV